MNAPFPPMQHEMFSPAESADPIVAIPPHIRVLQKLSSEPRSPSTPVHFLAMMIKNARQKSRTPVGTCLETLLPLVFVLGLMAIWAATNDGNTKDTQYVNTTATMTKPPDGLAAAVNILCTNGTSVPLLRRCTAADFAVSAAAPAWCKSLRPLPVHGLCVLGDAYSALKAWTGFSTARNLPSIDELILWQWIARMVASEDARSLSRGSALAAIANSGSLWFAPNNTNTANLISYLNSTSVLFPYIEQRIFNDVSTARDYVSSNAYADSVWAILETSMSMSSGIAVAVHVNRSGVPWTNQVLAVGNGIGAFTTGPYIASGFLTLQDAAYRFYELTTLRINPPNALVHIPMPFKGYDTSSFLVVVGALASLFLVFGYIYPVSQLVKRIVEEKEQKVREAMMIMGLSTVPFYCSWVLTYFIMQIVTSLVCAGVLKGTMFPQSDFAIIWALYFTFGLSNITFSSMVSSFFSKSRIAALVAPVIFFICAVPSFALPSTTPASILIIISILSPTAFANGMNVLVNQEVTGGMTNGTINESFNGYPMSIAIFMLSLDTVLYMLLTLYLDAVVPSEWGTRAHPCFCFVNPWRWFQRVRGHEDHSDEALDGRDPHGQFESITPHMKPSVEMRGMRKVFDTANGPMTAVNNLSFNLFEGQVFCLLGHNGAGKSTAMNLMTGMLDMDAGDCYFHGHSVKHDLAIVRREIGYCPQHNILWPELTCREHLHFFARLKGLDSAQREDAVVAVLKAVDLEDKADKFASELSGGQKRKLSVAIAFVGGSSVVFLDEPTAGMDVEARRHTWDLIKYMSVGRTIVLTTHYMEEADLLGHTIAIMSKGRLQCAGSSVFLKSRLGVGYTLTVTAAHGLHDASPITHAVQRYVPDATVLSDAAGEISFRLPMYAVPQFPELLRHLEDHGPSIGSRGHAISVTTLEEVFLKLGHDEEVEHAAANAADKGEASAAAAVEMQPKAPKELMFTPEVAACRSTFLGQFKCLIAKRFHYAKRDTRTIGMQIVLPVVAILFAMLLTLIQFPDCPRLDIGPGLYSDTVTSAYGNCAPNWKSYTVNDTVSIDSSMTGDITMSQYLLNTSKAHARHRIGSYLCNDTAIASPSTTFFTNTSIYIHAAPQAVWEVHTPYIRNGAQRAVPTGITAFPFPLSPREKGFILGIQTLFVALFVMIPLTFVPSTFVSFVVKERETRSLQLQQASGLNFIIYWVSNFCFDLVSFFMTAILIIVIFAIFGRGEYIGSAEKFFGTLLLFMLYGAAGVTSSYVLSFAFDSHSTAQNMVMLINFICGFMLVLLAYILSIIDSTQQAADVLKYFFRAVPSYCLGEGILNLANNDFVASFSAPNSTWSMSVVGWPMLYLAIEAPLFAALTLYMDSPLRRTQQHALTGDDEQNEVSAHEDPDVTRERHEVETGQRDATDVVVVKHLRKVYHGSSKLVAVKNLSFGVHKGEVFGFLGTNGAGKTTVISILCGEHMPTAGHGFVGGFDVVSQASEARKLIGYCPQFDATHDLLTVEEHLHLYCGLRGIDNTLRADVIERLISVCGLTEHRLKESRNLSGGNRRKLSVAISLVGAPQVVFLDEPSAGMDPMARRGLFDVIEQVARRCAVVLTTHHLEEVEALSHRVGIMVKGEMRCIGPLAALKNKFGTGFEMTLRVQKEDFVDACIAFIHGNLPHAKLQEQRGSKLTVALPNNTKLSQVFQLIEHNKAVLFITDYSVAQTSLESVFLRIADEK